MALAPPGCSQQPGKYKVPFGITTDDTLVSQKDCYRKQGPRAPRTKSIGEMIHHDANFQVRKFQCPVQNPKDTISPYMDVQDARTGRTGYTRRLFCTGLYRAGVVSQKYAPQSLSSVLPYPQRPLRHGLRSATDKGRHRRPDLSTGRVQRFWLFRCHGLGG